MSVIDPKISDRDKDAWNFYKKIYKNNPFFKNFNWDCEEKALFFLKEVNDNIDFNGDVIFNFSNNCTRLQKYLSYISNSELCDEYKAKLSSINSLLNISLLLSDGNIQGSKQGIGYDRGDTFIWALDQYFNGFSEIVLNFATWQMSARPRYFLEYIKSSANCEPCEVIFYYCNVFYNLEINISNKELIRDLIYSGSRAIDNEYAAIRYIELALRFWEARRTHINSYTNLNL
ncbi:MAG TPA: hypothetical protein P5529_03935 [Saccharofermentans sp.]|nr:hypothetical protein [Saccharofermentans sp.]